MGFYWKYIDNDTLYWSDNLYIFTKTKIFSSTNQFMLHRKEQKFKKDFSDIHLRKNKELYNRIPSFRLKKLRNAGCYWQYKSEKYIYWCSR